MPGAAHYQVQWDNVSTFSSPVTQNVADTQRDWRVASYWTEDVTYYWRVRAVSAAGQAGTWSSYRTFRIDQFSRMMVTWTELYVFDDGDAGLLGNGEMYWYVALFPFPNLADSAVLDNRTSANTKDVATGQLYPMNLSRTIEARNGAGANVSVFFRIREEDTGTDEEGFNSRAHDYVVSTNQWLTGSFYLDVSGVNFRVRVGYTIVRVD